MPLDGLSNRGMERLAMVFLALADVHTMNSWKKAKGYNGQRSLRSRDIIEYLNAHFEEKLSRGSYDDIRTEELKPLALGCLAVISVGKPNSSRNDPTRAYALPEEVPVVLRVFGTRAWHSAVKKFLAEKQTLALALSHVRPTQTLPVKLPSGVTLEFSPGPHNQLQKAVIEEFLPRYGYGAEVLYVGMPPANTSSMTKRDCVNLISLNWPTENCQTLLPMLRNADGFTSSKPFTVPGRYHPFATLNCGIAK